MICRMTMDAFRGSSKRIDPRLVVRLVKAYALWKIPAPDRRLINQMIIKPWPSNITGQSMKTISTAMPTLVGAVVDCPMAHVAFIALLAEPAKAYDKARQKARLTESHSKMIKPYRLVRPARVEQVEAYYVADVTSLCERIKELEGLLK